MGKTTAPVESTEASMSCLPSASAKRLEKDPLSMRALISFCLSASKNNLKVMLTGARLLLCLRVGNPAISISEGSTPSEAARDRIMASRLSSVNSTSSTYGTREMDNLRNTINTTRRLPRTHRWPSVRNSEPSRSILKKSSSNLSQCLY